MSVKTRRKKLAKLERSGEVDPYLARRVARDQVQTGPRRAAATSGHAIKSWSSGKSYLWACSCGTAGERPSKALADEDVALHANMNY